MGLFDSIKNLAKGEVENTIRSTLDNVKSEAANHVENKIEESMRDKLDNLGDDVKEYIEVNKDKVTNSEGKETMENLSNMITSLQSTDHIAKEYSEEEKQKFSELGDKNAERFRQESENK